MKAITDQPRQVFVPVFFGDRADASFWRNILVSSFGDRSRFSGGIEMAASSVSELVLSVRWACCGGLLSVGLSRSGVETALRLGVKERSVRGSSGVWSLGMTVSWSESAMSERSLRMLVTLVSCEQ